MNQKTVTEAARAANRANGGKSPGPRTEEGKERSKMNALKHGQYAARPSAAELLLAGDPEKEQAERQALREEMVRRYQPADSFGEQQAEELGDFHFELSKIERAKQAIWERERELLDLEQRRRALAVRPRRRELARANSAQVDARGLTHLPDSPGKLRELRELLQELENCLAENDYEQAQLVLGWIYGCEDPSWQGHWAMEALKRLRAAAAEREADEQTVEDEETDGQQTDQRTVDDEQTDDQTAEDEQTDQQTMEDAEGNLAWLQDLVADELAQVRERLELCELEQGELSPAGQAARLLEATHSKRWAWVYHQENFLRRSIDRKVRILIDLRREKGSRDGAVSVADAGPPGEQASDSGGDRAPEPAPDPVGAASEPPVAAPESPGPDVGAAREPPVPPENTPEPGNETNNSFGISEGSESEGGDAGRSQGSDEGGTASSDVKEPAPETSDQQ